MNSRPGITFIRKGRLLKPIWDGKYLVVRLSDHQHRKTGPLIHRLVADAFLPCPLGMTRIRHRAGDNRNNSVDNLEWSNDSILKRRDLASGRSRRASGEESGAAVLTWEAVDEMRRKYQLGEGSMHSLAREYGVAYATARQVIKEITWTKKKGDGDERN